MQDQFLLKLRELLQQKKYPELLQLMEKEVRKKKSPYKQDYRAYLLYADGLRNLEKFSEAAHAYEYAATSGGTLASTAWFYAAVQYNHAKNIPKAVECFKKCIALEPDNLQARANFCEFLYGQGKILDATPHAKWLMEYGTQSNHFLPAGYVFRSSGLHDEALQAFYKALEVDPDNWNILGSVLQAAQHGLDWPEVERLSQKMLQEVYIPGKYELSRELHLVHISWCMDEKHNYEVSKALVNRFYNLENTKQYDHSAHKWGERLKVGYVSSDLRNHAMLHLICGVFRNHDRSNYEIFVYDHSPNDNSWIRNKFLQYPEHHIDTKLMTDLEVADKIYSDGIDILIDLNGFTEKHRLAVLVHRPAPVQVTYMGYPGTSGANFFDYTISDAIITPDSSKPYYTEKLVRMPEQYQANDDQRAISDQPTTRADHGLPETAFVFACFNQPYKVDALMFDTWMKIMAQVPHSILWMLDVGEMAERKLRTFALKYGVNGDRFIFSKKKPLPTHLERVHHVDLTLDTRVYNGHTINSDSLWAGVPVITCRGKHFASRVASSLLSAVGLEECICESLEEMQAKAVDLALHPDKLLALRQKLEKNRFIKPLYDSERFTRHLEQACTLMAQNAKAGLEPQHIDVPALPPRTTPFATTVPTITLTNNKSEDEDVLDILKNIYQSANSYCPICKVETAISLHKLPFDLQEELLEQLPENFPKHTFWVQCTSCSHVLNRFHWTQEGNKLIFEAIHNYEMFYSDTNVNRQAANAVIRLLLPHLHNFSWQAATPLKWLEVYPRNGWLYSTALEYGFAGTAVLEHEKYVEPLLKGGGVAVKNDIMTIEINGKPDVISLQGSLERIAYLDLILDRIHKLLAHNGLIVITAVNAISVECRLAKEKFLPWRDLDRVHMFNSFGLTHLLKKHGFKMVDFQTTTLHPAGMVLIAQKIDK